ncbi:hypothetical protein ACU82A_31635 [Bacillus cereus]
MDSIVYDNIKGMVVKGYAINKSDLVLNFDESTQEKQKSGSVESIFSISI